MSIGDYVSAIERRLKMSVILSGHAKSSYATISCPFERHFVQLYASYKQVNDTRSRGHTPQAK